MIKINRTEIEPIFAEYSYHRKFRSIPSNALLEVTAKSTGTRPNGGVTLTVTITRKGGTGPNIEKELYSLLNLGLQGRRRGVFIEGVTRGRVTFRRLKQPPKNAPSSYAEEKVRGPYGGSDQPKVENQRIRRVVAEDTGGYNKHRAWYMSFEGGTCELEVVAYIIKTWNRVPSGDDDWAPPPPDPGGEYGEDEEPGDLPEDDGEEKKKKKKARKKRSK